MRVLSGSDFRVGGFDLRRVYLQTTFFPLLPLYTPGDHHHRVGSYEGGTSQDRRSREKTNSTVDGTHARSHTQG